MKQISVFTFLKSLFIPELTFSDVFLLVLKLLVLFISGGPRDYSYCRISEFV